MPISCALQTLTKRFKSSQCSEQAGVLRIWLFSVQIVLGVLSAWGVGIYTAMKVFGGKKEEPAPAH